MKPALTGIISDLRMLKHKSKRSHPQTPKRLSAILEQLQKDKYFTHPNIQYINQYERFASDQEIGYVYPDNYIKYIKQLWPKATHKTDLTVLDTYFNEHSQKIARLSVGGVLQGIDHIMSGRWKNGFSLIRPPGHHSGVKNTINGFCIFNNIAIGARYLQEKYNIKKIAILDYDIHRGDGTHFIFREDPSILFISTHRYDHGTSYPAGPEGNYDNCGVGQGKGSKLNIPLNAVSKNFKTIPEQTPGDNEYIYIYERIIHPIIAQFDPEVILVSSGFDAARFDPLGGFTITPNGYYYMTRRLMQFKKPLLCVLEGGYNLQQTALAVSSVVSALIMNQELPQPIPNITYENISKFCSIPKIYWDDIHETLDHHSKYWKSLSSSKLEQYTSLIKSNDKRVIGVVKQSDSSSSSSSDSQQQKDTQVTKPQVQKQSNDKIVQSSDNTVQKQLPEAQKKIEENQSTTQFYFAAGHMQRFKNFSLNNEKILKWAYPQENKFYQSDFPEKKFAPSYFGKQGEYISIENILYKLENPIIIDIKLSRMSKNPINTPQKIEKQRKKQQLSSAQKYSFRIGGFTTPDYKEGGMLVSQESIIKKILRKVVDEQNKHQFSAFLKDFISIMKNVKRSFFGTSILLIKGKGISRIKWVDFHYWYQIENDYDHDLIEGLQNLEKFISQLSLEE